MTGTTEAYVCLFFFGLASPMCTATAYNYLLEFLPEKYQTHVNTAIMAVDGGAIAIGTMYFKYISRDWTYFMFVLVSLGVLTCIISPFFPESPRYYLSKK